MPTVDMAIGGHQWLKQNLITIVKGKTNYDEMKCGRCGLKGRTSGLTHIKLSDSYSEDKINLCPGWSAETLAKRIRISHCTAVGPAFANLTPGSEHDTVEPAQGYQPKPDRVWVMGVGEPVCVLRTEFIDITPKA